MSVKEILANRLANLLSVKSLVTLILTLIFAYLAATHKIAQDFMTVYAVVIAFYFGTQARVTTTVEDKESKKETEKSDTEEEG